MGRKQKRASNTGLAGESAVYSTVRIRQPRKLRPPEKTASRGMAWGQGTVHPVFPLIGRKAKRRQNRR